MPISYDRAGVGLFGSKNELTMTGTIGITASSLKTRCRKNVHEWPIERPSGCEFSCDVSNAVADQRLDEVQAELAVDG